MITRAIVEELIDENQVRVRIPIIHRSKEDTAGTPRQELPIASICTLPGVKVFC